MTRAEQKFPLNSWVIDNKGKTGKVVGYQTDAELGELVLIQSEQDRLFQLADELRRLPDQRGIPDRKKSDAI